MGSKSQNCQMWKMEVLGTELNARQCPEAHIRPSSLTKILQNQAQLTGAHTRGGQNNPEEK